jgi:hypothetical protein
MTRRGLEPGRDSSPKKWSLEIIAPDLIEAKPRRFTRRRHDCATPRASGRPPEVTGELKLARPDDARASDDCT